MSPSSFYTWRQRLKSPGDGADMQSSLVPVRFVADQPCGSGEITVELADILSQMAAIRVCIPPGCDETSIRRSAVRSDERSRIRAILVLSFLPTTRVYAYVKPADMRKSFSGLVGIVEQELGQQVEAGGLFLFFNRRHNSVKVLFFTGDGLASFYRRLERGTFELPRAAADAKAAAQAYVVEHVRHTYACPGCRAGNQVVTTVKPPVPIDKSPLGARLLAWIVSAKFERHLPTYRHQEMLVGPLGIWLSRPLLWKLLAGAADLSQANRRTAVGGDSQGLRRTGR